MRIGGGGPKDAVRATKVGEKGTCLKKKKRFLKEKILRPRAARVSVKKENNNVRIERRADKAVTGNNAGEWFKGA